MKEEGIFDYHLYTLEHPTSLADNQTKQVALLTARKVPIRKDYQLDGADFYYYTPCPAPDAPWRVGVHVRFENRETSHLGMPLPKGVFRMYKRDKEGRVQFVGEDSINHTPKNEEVRVRMGDAFDLIAHRKQTDYKRLPHQGRFDNVHETAHELEIRNAKTDAVTVRVLEPLPGDWEILRSSHPCQKVEAGKGLFLVQVPAEGSATLTYRVRAKW
jgi:hypothetical protein